MCKRNRISAFTLIELSVVLIIIGLIVGGILVGRDLISSAQVRSEIAQLTKISTAYRTFQGKYNAIPGDFCKNASTFGLFDNSSGGSGPSYSCWPSADNGIIDDNILNTPIHGAQEDPIFFFGHLVQAGLLPANWMTGNCTSLTAGNTYGSHFAAAGIAVNYYGLTMNPSVGMVAQTYQGNNWLYLGVTSCTQNDLQSAGRTANGYSTGYLQPGAMTPGQA